jgi:hypothetical protein
LKNVGFIGDNMSGLAVQLAPLGVQLFVWAHGRNLSPFTQFLDRGAQFSMPGMPELGHGALVLADVQSQNASTSDAASAGADPLAAKTAGSGGQAVSRT